MRHHGSPKNSYGDIQAFCCEMRREPFHNIHPHRLREKDLDRKTSANRGDEHQDECFHLPDAEVLDDEKQHRIKTSNDDSVQQWHFEEKVEADCRAEYFGKITRGNGNLAENPQY